jgi:hypothetical protein
MRVQQNQLSMQLMLEKEKMSGDGQLPIVIRLTLLGRTKKFFPGIKIHPGTFNEKSQLVFGNCPKALAINKVVERAKVSLYNQCAEHEWSLGDIGYEATKKYIKCSTLKDAGHESK